MERKGFISIISLIIMSIILTISLYLVYLSKLEYSIISSNDLKNQTYYESEGKSHLALYDEKYYHEQFYPNILDVFRTNNFGSTRIITLDSEDLTPGDKSKYVKLKFFKKDNRMNLEVETESEIRNIKSRVITSGTLVREIFEIERPILSRETVGLNHENDFEYIINLIDKNININNCNKPDTMFGSYLTSFDKIILKRKDSKNNEIISTRDTMMVPSIESFDKKEVFIIAKNQENKNINFFIGDPINSSGKMELSGILFVQGDIIISSEIIFKGIIIVKNGRIIVNSVKKPTIYGMIIMDNNEKAENYDDIIEKTGIIYSSHTVYRFGTYLPGFLDLKLDKRKGI